MSRIWHDSPAMDKLAKRWHMLGAVLNGVSVFVSLMGVVWHLWATTQHNIGVKNGK